MPSKKYLHDIDLQGGKLINVGPDNATIDSGLGSGGSDPALENRVEKLENQAATILSPFSDTFDTEALIDWDNSSNVTRQTSGGDTYVAISLLTVTSNANLQTDVDASNSSAIEYSGGAVRNQSLLQGVYTTRLITINASTQAAINAAYTTPSANTFDDESLYTIGNLNTNIINLFTVADTNTRWFFYQTLAGYGDLYGWAVNTTNGNTVMSHRRIGTAGQSGNLTQPNFRTLSAKLDNNGNAWVSAFRYIGGTAAANIRMCTYRILKSSPASDNYTDERVPLNASPISSIDTFFDTATDRYHAFCAHTSATNTQLLIYNSNNGATATFNKNTDIVGTAGWGTISSLVWNAKVVRSSTASNEVAIFMAYSTSTTNSIRAVRYKLDNDTSYGTVSRTVIQFSPTGATNGIFDIAFEPAHGFVGVNIRNNNATMDLIKITPTFSVAGDMTIFGNHTISPTIPTNRLSSGISDGTHFYFAGIGNDGAYDRLYYSKLLLTTGSVASATGGVLHQRISGVTQFINYDFDQPLWVRSQSGDISLFYEKNTGSPNNAVASVPFGSFNSKLKIEAQMVGQDWETIFDNTLGINQLTQSVTLASSKQTQIRLRFTMTPPNASTAVTTVSSFSITVPGSNSSGTLTTKSLINNRPIAKVTLSPDMVLTGDGIDGSITWQASNQAGAAGTWINQTNATDFIFASFGTDLRLRANINIPLGSTGFSPRIKGYSGTAGDVARQSDLTILNVNLLKTTLQLNTLLTSNRLGWTNMMVDTFTSGDGVTLGAGVTLSGGTITGTGNVTSVMEEAEINPVNSIVVVAEYAGGVVFKVSRDGGLTFPYIAVPNTVTALDGSESVKDEIVIRAEMTSGTLYGWAYLYA